ncbi:MAG: hypothetical protein KDD53_12225 [Bdellovibrionales bacterium]|nr:hypothetical protein [Bdellovibrionales bacterium]
MQIDSDAYNLFEFPNLTGTPERNLLLAVLERAILDFVGNDAKESESAATWLFDESDEDDSEQFTFPWICNQLGLDKKGTIFYISNLPKRGNRRVAPWYFERNQEIEKKEICNKKAS